jgi:hypothetical protein
MEYVTRSYAMRAAKSLGWEYFRTEKHAFNGTWKASQTHTSQVIDFSWTKGKDFVAWTEVHRDNTGTCFPVLIVSCTRMELEEENIPDNFMIEPQSFELFEHQDTKAPRIKKEQSQDSKAPRPKSEVASPTKLVWTIADTMPTASRKDIIAECVKQGVHISTASTQFSKWRKSKTC